MTYIIILSSFVGYYHKRYGKGTKMQLTENAFAKINLFLDVDGIRADGYHNILSFMQTVTLMDKVTVAYTPSDVKNISVSCSDPRVPTGEDNIVYKVANAFPCTGEITIHIHKMIPLSAGLAGGSADAAATLRALNKLCGEPMSLEELKAIGLKFGADIPFCIEKGAAIAEGVGEKLTPVSPMPHYPIVIAKKGDGMSTPEAYKALDLKYNRFKDYTPAYKLLEGLKDPSLDIEAYCKNFFNIFEETVSFLRPDVKELKNTMLSQGAVASMMSGSGTAVFGIFKRPLDAINAVTALQSIGAEAYICNPYKKL